MTADHIRAILNSERDSKSFWRMCQEFARGRLPEEILRAVRIGRMTALLRGIVVGDFVRPPSMYWWTDDAVGTHEV